MKTYIVYDSLGVERGTLKAKSHNAAERQAQEIYGPQASVAHTGV